MNADYGFLECDTNTSSELRKPQISYKNVGVIVIQINVFIHQFTTCFGPDRPSSGGS
jgi:hypothetical protein